MPEYRVRTSRQPVSGGAGSPMLPRASAARRRRPARPAMTTTSANGTDKKTTDGLEPSPLEPAATTQAVSNLTAATTARIRTTTPGHAEPLSTGDPAIDEPRGNGPGSRDETRGSTLILLCSGSRARPGKRIGGMARAAIVPQGRPRAPPASARTPDVPSVRPPVIRPGHAPGQRSSLRTGRRRRSRGDCRGSASDPCFPRRVVPGAVVTVTALQAR